MFALLRYRTRMADEVLNRITHKTETAIAATRDLYTAIREAKDAGYAYSELEQATGLQRGTLQNIISGRNPRLTIE